MNHVLVSPSTDRRAAGLSRIDSTTDLTFKVNASGKEIKRRSSRACQCCRVRKIKCDVVECGVPCRNCIANETQCIVIKSKWRKGRIVCGEKPQGVPGAQVLTHEISDSDVSIRNKFTDVRNAASKKVSSPVDVEIDTDDGVSMTARSTGLWNQSEIQDLIMDDNQQDNMLPKGALNDLVLPFNLVNAASFCGDLVAGQNEPRPTPSKHALLPAYIKPLPDCMTSDDIHYIWKKDAFSIPKAVLRDALLRCYIEFVYPYMPAIELYEFLHNIEQNNGEDGKISLLLFQAIMFAGTAFVDMALLEAAGYTSRKAARKAFYHKVRILYDSDYEIDRIAIVQSLLLMTYWYEKPDDPKDAWHWMGIASSITQTVGLHKNPEESHMDVNLQRLWRRIWWSCFMRDQLVALGLSRSTWMKEEDYDIPMLTLDDFNIEASSTYNLGLLADCTLIRDTFLQTDLALMCIAKARLCVCISQVLSTRYYRLVRDQRVAHQDNIRANFAVFPEHTPQDERTQRYDSMLVEWNRSLPARYLYTTPSVEEISRSRTSFFVQRALLHMVYFAAVSALHRLNVLPTHQNEHYLLDDSRRKTREASRQIGKISLDLLDLKLEGFLPTSSLTVLLPATMLHLLNIKSSDDTTRKEALQGFSNCAKVLEKLRDKYCAADYAFQFLEAAIRKADINLVPDGDSHREVSQRVGRERTVVHEISQLVRAGGSTSLREEGFPITATPYINSAWPSDNERDSSQVQSFDSAHGIFDIFGAELNRNVESLISNFDISDEFNDELWESTLHKIMTCESGGLLADMNWFF